MNTEENLNKIYPSGGLNSDWCCKVWFVDSDLVIFDDEDGEYSVIRYQLDDNEDRIDTTLHTGDIDSCLEFIGDCR